ncbi:amino acid adenylation domain-containing protein (plasmid) [Legionella lytica]|uniref:Amino acid adenylation domain-containing protein n=1 Tax=Legionella lytica TaxID=96232 RepID=A0ABY4YCA8_9GAMM|nr:amino acid adenylation domain-containing protein [Legionella lytica]USQ15251.1 amino acid adenylation domain-containing protein [Legionella lytica]
MEKKQSFSCYVIGNDTLTMHCASILVEKNHSVWGIISTSHQIKAWCQEHNIPFINSLHEFEQRHIHTSFDYLFSIVNDVILPESILRAPRLHAINYHNSPLPKYAGLYATSWAILNNESEHAISWHLIEPQIDAGAIVKQSVFPIEKEDTALNLNLKCYEAAIESFASLVDELASNKECLVPQNLEHRSYYGLKNKPKNLGFVAWDSSADDIDRLCRALSLGSYRNELATAKLFINDQWYIINAHRILHVTSQGVPGTIVHLSKNEVQITTNTVDIALLSIMDAEGVIYDMERWSTLCALSVGQILPNINQLEYPLMVSMPKIEKFWVQEYTHYIHHDLSFLAPLNRAQKSDSGRRSSLVLPQHISHQVHHYSSTMTIQPDHFLLTVVLTYLYRLNDYKNFSLQISDSERSAQLGKFSFFFSETYPLTTNLSHDLSFGETLSQVTNEILRLTQHDTFCNDLFVRYPELQVPQKEVLIRFINDQEPISTSTEEYKLIISISKNGSGLHIHNKTNYQDNESSYAFFNRVEEHLALLLEDALAHPDKKLYELTILSQEELGLMNSWNNTDFEYDSTQLLHQKIEQQVLKSPQKTAAYFEGQTISYELLDKKANQLAHYLLHQGVQPNDSIGVHLHRSLDMLISILGILKSGAAYLPLDPHYPHQRIQYILKHSQTRYLITHEPHLSHQLSDYNGIIINPNKVPYREFVSTQPLIKTQSSDLAYIIYTSGTTGTPKGVGIPHQAACNHMTWMKTAYDFKPDDRFLLKTPFSFDASVWEIFMPLIVGGLLVIAPDEAHTNPKELIDLIIQNQITIIQLVPSMLREITLTQGFGSCSSLRHLFCGGEALLPETIHGFYEHNTFQAQLHNLYGPTEATIDAVTRTCSIEDSERSISLIGTPIFNTRAYILDQFMKMVPAGVLGELYLSGDGLAKGYLHNSHLTEQKFIPNPFHPKTRLYKTGDLVKWHSDGAIEYHGRADEQIKIRGFRIEISEIESCLEKIHAVYQCLVKPERTSDTAVSLSAYLVIQEDTHISANELRATLKKELPDYMIPSRFYIVEQLFFTPNGKLDRKHVPTPIKNLSIATQQQIAPETKTQKQLHRIWCDVLKKEVLGIDDDFFEQGGHSLLAMQIISGIHERLSIKLSIRALFDYPSIRLLAQEIERLLQKSPFNFSRDIHTIIPLKKSGHKIPLFLVHPVGGSVFWYTALAKNFDKQRPLYALQDPALETQSFLFEHLEEMASCYIENIKRIQPQGPYLIGGASFGASVAIEIAKQLQNRNEDIAAIISLDGWAEYPALQSNEAHFKELMQEQNTRLLEDYQKNNLKNANFLLEMQWHREQMLMRYAMPRIKAPLILFKASHLSPLFQYDAPLNWWDQYADVPIECYLTPGDHESMFYEENSKVLAKLIHHSLMDKDHE